ncbi:unnamed protein product [Plutella xylostella]|uniref:(diamondback moth) hypothetical protein n=1 Tax=Plutella xylostella TaxID=51655 RepID=A0A8S4G0F2_PLUXY|nr:unnamed protein product [Plutella xylostella]
MWSTYGFLLYILLCISSIYGQGYRNPSQGQFYNPKQPSDPIRMKPFAQSPAKPTLYSLVPTGDGQLFKLSSKKRNLPARECPENEIWKFGTYCQITCETYNEKMRGMCPAVSKLGCFCLPGLVRAADGSCVPPEKCRARRVLSVGAECKHALPPALPVL